MDADDTSRTPSGIQSIVRKVSCPQADVHDRRLRVVLSPSDQRRQSANCGSRQHWDEFLRSGSIELRRMRHLLEAGGAVQLREMHASEETIEAELERQQWEREILAQ